MHQALREFYYCASTRVSIVLLDGRTGKAVLNSQHTDDVSMHRFPMKEKARLNKWTAFARRHRPKFTIQNQKYCALCSTHFADSAYTVNAEIAKSLKMKDSYAPTLFQQ